jgi:exopolyphosphatase/guanosine-5'-triphosphate,3'-diphosphate pyrophosphatase
MRIAIIDLGTNSVRFDIYQINDKNGSSQRLYREKIMVRLGQEIFSDGTLNSSAARRTLNAFVRFAKISKHFNTAKTVAFATSALREAKKPERLLLPIEKKTGIKLQIISGKREAALIARGITKNIKTPRGTFGLIDIGGGSTEVTIYRNSKIIFSDSFPIGTARIQQLFLTKIPPNAESVLKARESIQNTIHSVLKNNNINIRLAPQAAKFIGSSGTVKALDKMLRNREHKKVITKKHLDKLINDIAPLSFKQLVKVPCMEPKRVDQIVSGSIILQEFLKAFKGKEVSFTEYCLRDGIFDEEVMQVKSHNTKTQFEANFNEIFQRAYKWSRNERILQNSIRLTDIFFNSTQFIHKLDQSYLAYLKTAMLFRNVGEVISFQNHGEHSAYVVKNSCLPYFNNLEIETIALICKFHEAKINSFQAIIKDLKLSPRQIKIDSKKALTLIGLMQVMDHLDEHNLANVNFKKAKGQLIIYGKQLESYQFDQACHLFNRIFPNKLISIS